MRAAFARGSFSTIRSMSATLSWAPKLREAFIRRTGTSFSPTLTTCVLSAALSMACSTSTRSGQSVLPSGCAGHQERVTRIFATESPLRTSLHMALTASRMSVSGFLDARMKSITTSLEPALGMTGRG